MRKRLDNVTDRLEALLRTEKAAPPTRIPRDRGRRWWTRLLDTALDVMRRYAPPVHWAGAAALALCLYIYTQLCALTVRLTSAGIIRWPDVPERSVLTIWHGAAGSLIVAVAAQRPRPRLAIMVASDPRGDSLSLLCKMLGLHVSRVSYEDRGQSALTELAGEIGRGACVIITADGDGPARLAKAGALVLASATASPILAVGADCYPAIIMPHKWDSARIPLPFGRLAIVVSDSSRCHGSMEATAIESTRLWLQQALGEAEAKARAALRTEGDRPGGG